MKMDKLILIFLTILFCISGCGGDVAIENDDMSSIEVEEQIPTVIIEKLGIDILRSDPESGDDFIAGILQWRLRAIPAPKTNLAIRLNDGYDWVIIPKSQNYSSVFRTLIRAAFNAELDEDILRQEGTHRLSSDLHIIIDPLPIKPKTETGIMVDQEQLQKYLPIVSLGKYTIHKGYEFPYYEIGNPSQLSINRNRRFVFASVVNVTPAGGEISRRRRIVVDFSNDPGNVAASVGIVSGTDRTRTISPPSEGYPVGELNLTIFWADGEHTLHYTVIAGDETPPKIVSSSPENGEKDVDPAVLLQNGIRITFSERVIGDLILLEGNDDIGWTDHFEGNTATLRRNGNQGLSNNTRYNVNGTVSDAAGNEQKVNITFITKR